MRIGIDFDNTIIDYGDIFVKQAIELDWIKAGAPKTKQQVRDIVRKLPDGEMKWKKMQGLVYGKLIGSADPFEGVVKFIERCRRERIDVFIVSHKTEYVEALEEKINLREAALNWLRTKGFLDPEKSCLDESRIFFEHPRENKLDRIHKLKCTHFIDDLEDVLLEPQFPENVTRILFADHNGRDNHKPLAVCHSWKEIETLVFEDAKRS